MRGILQGKINIEWPRWPREKKIIRKWPKKNYLKNFVRPPRSLMVVPLPSDCIRVAAPMEVCRLTFCTLRTIFLPGFLCLRKDDNSTSSGWGRDSSLTRPDDVTTNTLSEKRLEVYVSLP